MMVAHNIVPLLLSAFFFLFSNVTALSRDSLLAGESINQTQTLVSANGTFTLGFFSPGSSKNWYLGIWYTNIPTQTVVWVANREAPLTDPTGALAVLTTDGNLVVKNSTRHVVWSTSGDSNIRGTVARILDDGNLVVINSGGNYAWQSYEHPTEAMLPGMKIGSNPRTGEKSHKEISAIMTLIAILVVLGVILLVSLCCCPNKRDEYNQNTEVTDDLELPILDFDTVAAATSNFSDENKLGEGGFGPVYKGTLGNGQEVAVKRLAKTSSQGINEFKNEVMLIAKLQHRNLVRLLACCIHGDERMLIYEYMPNKSLDGFLFDKTKAPLDWQTRYLIITGIARGLLYLHQDSRFRIIHRDLKASNVLLDDNMNPKISDFGTARIFGADEIEANTVRVVGTYGYMSPEYALDGIFSIKSDVFSFGVLVLEIISGTKNRAVFHADPNQNLLGHAWKLWKEGQSLELIDPSMPHPFPTSEVLRCMKVGLLCVQEEPEDRLEMSTAVLMFASDTASLPEPKQPGYVTVRKPYKTDSSSTNQESCSVNHATLSICEGR